MQNKKKDALEVQKNAAEGKIRELNMKLEDVSIAFFFFFF